MSKQSKSKLKEKKTMKESSAKATVSPVNFPHANKVIGGKKMIRQGFNVR